VLYPSDYYCWSYRFDNFPRCEMESYSCWSDGKREQMRGQYRMLKYCKNYVLFYLLANEYTTIYNIIY